VADDPGRRRVVAITGGTGYLGSAFAHAFVEMGDEVRVLSRNGPRQATDGVTHVPFDLAAADSNVIEGGLDGVDVLVHAAHDFSPRAPRRAPNVNVAGSKALLDAARTREVDRVLYVSSVAAFPGARSVYGQEKLLVEAHTRAMGGSVIRPGLVWGDAPGSIFGALERFVRRAPVVPVFVPGHVRIVLVHLDDLTAAVTAIVGDRGRATKGTPYIAGAHDALSFEEVLRRLAGARPPRLVPLPWQAAWIGLRSAEACRLPVPFRSDSLRSLVHADPEPFSHAVDCADLGCTFRPFRERGR
jgi:nucleoside-diphosphate-sugar epimerase